MAYDEKFAARVRRRLVDRPGFSERKMFGGLCFLLNGHMCCGINGDDLMLRVHPDDYESTLERPGHGRWTSPGVRWIHRRCAPSPTR